MCPCDAIFALQNMYFAVSWPFYDFPFFVCVLVDLVSVFVVATITRLFCGDSTIFVSTIYEIHCAKYVCFYASALLDKLNRSVYLLEGIRISVNMLT